MAKMTGFKVYKGTKETFISSGKAAANADAIVYITGGTGNSKNSCIFAQGTYFADINEMIKAINFVKGVKVGESQYNATAGGGYIPFASGDNSTVSLDVQDGTITIGLTDAFVTKVNDTVTNLGTKDDAANSAGSAFARIANLAQLVSDLTGGSVDSIEGQISKAVDALRTELLGTLDDNDAKTIQAINDELDGIDALYAALEPRVQAIEDDYLKEADKTELGNRITNEAPVTITEAAGSGDILKTYTFTQNGKPIGSINLAKELVVTGGDIVDIDGVKNLQLTIANQVTPVNIPVNELVDAYTAKQNATQVQVAISDSNEVSASIVEKSISSTELADNAVVTAKITDKNVTKAKLAEAVQTSLGKADTAYQKPSAGIPKTDLASAVQTSLGKADAAAPQATTYTKTEVDNTFANYYTKTETYTKAEVDAMWEWEEL